MNMINVFSAGPGAFAHIDEQNAFPFYCNGGSGRTPRRCRVTRLYPAAGIHLETINAFL